ncbi:predicted protein [Arabidopsis lyrata subsp. lyrata]|uniref:Predicted protein n=1 Tax=Arabidopsis lyrata subsp. lyrata TaxID=81972 RepID=D7LQZ4_ARALL|nr:predicted protein [Arabidopsis lyrata subsp. lyrata]
MSRTGQTALHLVWSLMAPPVVKLVSWMAFTCPIGHPQSYPVQKLEPSLNQICGK